MSTDLTGKIHGLIQRVKSLKSDATGLFDRTRSSYVHADVLDTYFDIYNKIRNDIVGLFSSDKIVHSLPYLSIKSRGDKYELLKVVAGLGQVMGFLEGKQVDVLGTKVRTFPYQEKELDILPSTTRLLLLEAIGEYDYNHSYACCCISGLAFESLVKEGCKRNNLSYGGLANGIKTLKEAKVIKEDLYKSLVDLEKYYRDKISAHLTSEAATDEKARLFLSSLLSLAKTIFAS